MKRIVAGLCLVLASGVFSHALAQSGPTLSKEVREFVTVDSPAVALVHVRVVDGTGAPAAEDQTVVISGGKISAIGPAGSTAIPDGARKMDLPGYTVIPGMVGMHDHMFYPAPASQARPAGGNLPVYHELAFSFPRLYLGGGVTTIRTTGSIEGQTDLELKKLIDSGQAAGPKMFVTAPYLEGVGSFTAQMHELTGPEDAAKWVEFWAGQGATSFKVYMHITRAELAAVVEGGARARLEGHGAPLFHRFPRGRSARHR